MVRRVLRFDDNNNVLPETDTKCFIERHLELGGHNDFLIIPNGGSGDCMFKAVSQAVYDGDESKHKTIRKKVVEFIIKERWEKFKESIEVQHINGNNLLQRHWSKDPKQAYKMYMTLDGTLGSSSELTAAGELFKYNFVTIQEYCTNTRRTYRVENCILYEEDTVKLHHFYFTGDYDNGHWEFLKNLSDVKINDGTYKGIHKTLIQGEESTVEDWLQNETENTNDADRLKIATNRNDYLRQQSPFPFESNLFRFNEDLSVTLNNECYNIAEGESTDLFSVLARECLQNENAAHEAELVLMKHRYSYFEDINYKLITQPYSHNFTIEAIAYCGHPCKGNIQDLISAADLYSFSFVLFMKLDKNANSIHQCKFTHVDRWGGESDRTLYFFMKLVQSDVVDELNARWWRIVPIPNDESPPSEEKHVKILDAAIGDKQPIKDSNRLEKVASRKSLINLGSKQDPTRPASADRVKKHAKRSSSRTSSALPLIDHRSTSKTCVQALYTAPNCNISPENVKEESSEELWGNEGGMEIDACCRKDHENIFGSFSTTSKMNVMEGRQQSKLVKKTITRERIKRATGKDLLEHPEKVKTLVRLSDKNKSGREITYTGSGVLKANDILYDLKQKGLIRIPLVDKLTSRDNFFTKSEMKINRKPGEDMFMTLEKRHKDYESLRSLARNENFNIIPEKKADAGQSESDVSLEDFVPEMKTIPDTFPSKSRVIPLRQEAYHDIRKHQDKPEKSPKASSSKARKRKVSPVTIQPSRSSSRDIIADECSICVGRLVQVLFRIYKRIQKTCIRTKTTIRKRLEKGRAAQENKDDD